MGNCKFFSLEGVLNSWCFRLEHYFFWNTTGSYTFQSWICGCPNWTKFSERVQKWDYVDKNWENLEFWTRLLPNSRNFIPLFISNCVLDTFFFNVQVNGSSILQKHSWIESKLIIICKEKCFFSIFWILVSFGGQSFSNKFENLEFFHQFAFFWRPTTKKAANFSCKRQLWT